MTPFQKTTSAEIETARAALLGHSLYARLRTLEDLAQFMECHVFAVWDFMSLLKALQQRLTCVQVPWVPVGDNQVRRLVNEIVLGEESDRTPDGTPSSHYELYLQAMQEAGADTTAVQGLIRQLQQGTSVTEALAASGVPECVAEFVSHTFEVIAGGKPHVIAAAFTYGREDLIPAMFHELVARLEAEFPGRLKILRYYLDRHIQLDGDEHGEMGRAMVELLCEGNPQRESEARQAALDALNARLHLWDGIAERIVSR
ncbi:DUF3050 domain-containing protein [Prosthecobacter vanneervenii]|uniref:Heme oxygenase n=1 Tax=Prosthecobacter vanneervenii TaxID=48466 RepID=A0A7W7Y843_9BACT|nr:DUF3050 domain-containing protein [Prosthecobacter vanneervenii]MBB5031167.1 hypothetical protein [Prosthecobacter vanneervenii]